MGHWFFAPSEDWSDDSIHLPADESHHAARVLRIEPPSVITVFDGRGRVARCALGQMEDRRSRAEILEVVEHPKMRPQLIVYQAAAKAGKLDQTIEKLAELGVAEVWAFDSERTVARWDAGKSERLAERWNSIARSAAKQSRNPHLLVAGAGLSWTELVRRVSKEPMALTLWEGASLPMRAGLNEGADRVALVVGPEGGFTQQEAEALADAGAPLVSLGPRILRTENAAVVACSALLFHFGLIG
jgi:16S rRNA (uracil1498-N3)-methyltransferase